MLFKKRILCAAAAIMITAIPAAQANGGEISFVVGENVAQINGAAVSITPAYITNDTTLVPLRVIAEGLGADVQWNDGTVTVAYENTEIVLTIGSLTAAVNGEGKTLLAAPGLTSDTAMVPIRFISETLGADVEWDGDLRKVTVTKNMDTLAKIDNTKWQYNAEDNVYWQTGVNYCADPVDIKYETLGIFVPGEYMTAADNGDGTYTCSVNYDAEKSGYTAATAPIVIPVNTPGYSAMAAPTDYVNDASSYTKAGFIYVNAGCRGRNEGAPAGITDLKAAIRYIRSCGDDIAGNTDRIFSFGMSGGGAQSALLGATGDSDLYTPYLEAIGAVMDESDAVTGSMCWCPITNLDYADEAYEWNMGITRTDLSDDMQTLSDGLAEAFGKYINELGLKDENGNVLTLTEGENGIYASGPYYDYIKSEIERSLNNFLSDTEFPYTKQSGGMFGGPGGGRDFGGEMPDFGGGMPNFEEKDGINRTGGADDKSGESVTYRTAEEYIASLNDENEWISYDKASNTATVTSVEDFVKACKNASKSVGAFDDLNGTQGENTLFGYGDGKGAHFDPIMAELLKDTEYGEAYAADLAKTDALGKDVSYRMNAYNPMYYIEDYYEGCGTSKVADYWRIRTGINQGDTALSTEINLALALRSYGKDVDFETVWGQGHTMAERTGNSTDNLIEWINSCLNK